MEILLHPVRIRILQVFMTGDKLTAQQISKKLANVATPTLYRHLNTLLENGLIHVVEENQIRGTVEKVYALQSEKIFTEKDLENATREDHVTFFMTFLTSLLTQFHDYMMADDANPMEDKLSYRQVQLYLTDDEFMEMFAKIREAILPHLQNESNKERKLYTVSNIFFPNESDGKEKK